MASPLFTPGGSRSRTGSRLVLGGLLALAIIVGMLAMHSLHLGSSATMHSTTADVLAKQVAGPAVVTASALDGQGSSAGAPCPNCPQGEVSMTANCLAAVVLGLLVVLPGPGRACGMMPPPRAGPQLEAGGLLLGRAPSLNVLCINRC